MRKISLCLALGVASLPSLALATNPMWCMYTGVSQLVQPFTDPGKAVFTAGGLGAITANLTNPPTPYKDGDQAWAPVVLGKGAPINNRFPVLNLTGVNASIPGPHIVIGDQSGNAYALSAKTGALVWRGSGNNGNCDGNCNGGASLGDTIQAQPVVQLRSRSNSTFQTKFTGDLLFFGTRNTGSSLNTNNKVYALNSKDGSVAWMYNPGNLDAVTGLLVDAANNQLWVASYSNNKIQPSLRVLDTTTGALVTPNGIIPNLPMVDLDNGIVRDFAPGNSPAGDQVYAVDKAGVVYGISIASRTKIWNSTPLGELSSYPFPTGWGFIASLKSGSVNWYAVTNGTTFNSMPVGSVPIATPSGVRIDYTNQKVFVGSSDGKLHQIKIANWSDEKQVSLPLTSSGGTPTVGMPALDTAANRVHVGTLDGHLCAYQVPLN